MRISKALKNQKYATLLYFNKRDREDKIEFTELIEAYGVNDLKYSVDVLVQKCYALHRKGLIEGIDKLSDYLVQETKTIKISPTNLKSQTCKHSSTKYLQVIFHDESSV